MVHVHIQRTHFYVSCNCSNYTQICGERRARLELKCFIMEICISLLEGYGKCDTVRPGHPNTVDKPQRLMERHWLEPTGKGRPQCVVCCDMSISGGRQQTHFCCRQCRVALCAYPCNERYLTMLNYKLCHLFSIPFGTILTEPKLETCHTHDLKLRDAPENGANR